MSFQSFSMAMLAAWLLSGCAPTDEGPECNQGNCDELAVSNCDEIGLAGRCTLDGTALEYCIDGELLQAACSGSVDGGVIGGGCFIGTTGHAYCENFCALEDFMCADGECISQDKVCDGSAQCLDQSDEDQTLCEIYNSPTETCAWLKGHNYRACSGGTDWDPGCGWQFCLPNGTWSEDCGAKPEVYPCLDDSQTCEADAICR